MRQERGLDRVTGEDGESLCQVFRDDQRLGRFKGLQLRTLPQGDQGHRRCVRSMSEASDQRDHLRGGNSARVAARTFTVTSLRRTLTCHPGRGNVAEPIVGSVR